MHIKLLSVSKSTPQPFIKTAKPDSPRQVQLWIRRISDLSDKTSRCAHHVGHPSPRPDRPAMDWCTSVRQRPASDAVLRDIHASDQDMYPADLPFSRLQGWAHAAPDLSIEFFSKEFEDEVSVGVVVALPVRLERWHALLDGSLKETNVEASSDFGLLDQSESQRAVGVHIFHIERHASLVNGLPVKGFGKYAVDVAVEAARARGHVVIGTSGTFVSLPFGLPNKRFTHRQPSRPPMTASGHLRGSASGRRDMRKSGRRARLPAPPPTARLAAREPGTPAGLRVEPG